ncbi:MAG: hypothetical protein JST52_00930 [Bacteroidetes bacterium]|nr:hypothetical protein [Bacteroidota bacterium]MBS1739180.1 hypothetical protein [Bacteroidota bacterium]
MKSKHKSIVSESLFFRIQDILDGKAKLRIAANPSRLEGLPLRGYLLCPRSGRILTGSSSYGNSSLNFYYHCTGGCKERVKAAVVNDYFVWLLIMLVRQNEKAIHSFEKIRISKHKENGRN